MFFFWGFDAGHSVFMEEQAGPNSDVGKQYTSVNLFGI